MGEIQKLIDNAKSQTDPEDLLADLVDVAESYLKLKKEVRLQRQQAVAEAMEEAIERIQRIKFPHQTDEHVEALTAVIEIIDQVKESKE